MKRNFLEAKRNDTKQKIPKIPKILYRKYRVGHRVLLRSERYVLLRSKKRTLRSFPFFSRVFGDLWNPKERYVLFRSFQKNGKERKERNVLFKRTEKNAKNVTFFWKERKRTRERNVLCKWIWERNVLCYLLFSRYI